MTATIRIVLADDHPIVLGGLRHLIQAENDLEIVGEATTGAAAFEVICAQSPDIAVVDISMPGLNGIVLSRKLAAECPAARVLVLTFHEDRAYVNQARLAGVRGYVLKRSAAENLIAAIRVIRRGGFFLDPAIAETPGSGSTRAKAQMSGSLPGKPAPQKPGSRMTDREAEVVKLVALGFTNKEIAGRLYVGVKTIETHRARASEKLGLRTRADIVRYASTQGWLADA
jgi:DNA-binding NarL/FixJ family response regulator